MGGGGGGARWNFKCLPVFYDRKRFKPNWNFNVCQSSMIGKGSPHWNFNLCQSSMRGKGSSHTGILMSASLL